MIPEQEKFMNKQVGPNCPTVGDEQGHRHYWLEGYFEVGVQHPTDTWAYCHDNQSEGSYFSTDPKVLKSNE